MRALGATAGDAALWFPLREEDEREADALLAESGVAPERAWWCIRARNGRRAAGRSSGSPRWPTRSRAGACRCS